MKVLKFSEFKLNEGLGSFDEFYKEVKKKYKRLPESPDKLDNKTKKFMEEMYKNSSLNESISDKIKDISRRWKGIIPAALISATMAVSQPAIASDNFGGGDGKSIVDSTGFYQKTKSQMENIMNRIENGSIEVGDNIFGNLVTDVKIGKEKSKIKFKNGGYIKYTSKDGSKEIMFYNSNSDLHNGNSPARYSEEEKSIEFYKNGELVKKINSDNKVRTYSNQKTVKKSSSGYPGDYALPCVGGSCGPSQF